MNERESRMQRPTYIKVHRKHLSLATIEAYELPWEWDEVSFLFLVEFCNSLGSMLVLS